MPYQPGQQIGPPPVLTEDPTKPPRVEMVKPAEKQTEVHPHTLDCSVKEFILRRLESFEDDGENNEEAIVRVVMENVLFYRGQSEYFVTKDCRIESSYDDDDEDTLVKHNWYAHLVEGKAKEWEASKPKIEITGRTTDYRLEGAAKLAEALDRFTRKNSIKAHFRQSEAKFGMLCKVYYRLSVLEVDETDETATRVKIPITEKKKFHVGAAYQCSSCSELWGEDDHLDGYGLNEEIPAPEMVCPKCGATDGHEEIAPRFPFEQEVDVDEREEIVPSLRHITINPLNVKIEHSARRFQDAQRLLYETLESRDDLEAEYENENLSKVESASNLPARLSAQLELERTSAGVDAIGLADVFSGRARDDDQIRKRMFWMLPKKYRHKRVRADEELCGVKFKAGDRLGDTFKSGWLTVVLGENHIVKLADESKNKRWAGSAFTLDPTTYHGKGTEDLNSIQMSIDDMATLANSHFDRAGAPSEVINLKLVDMDEFDGTTGKRIPMKDTAPDDAKASEVVHVVESGTLGSDFQTAFAQQPIIMREIGGVSKGMVGQEDPNNRTARGQELAAAASSSMLIPSLALRAEEVETETTYQNLEYWKEFGADEDFALFETEYGSEAIETFKKLNLRRDLNVEAVPGSWVPQTKDQELQNTEDFTVKYLVPAAQGVIPMSFVRHAAGLYNIPQSVFEPERDAKLAQARLARLRGWAEEAYNAGATELDPVSYEAKLDEILADPDFIPSPLMEAHEVHMEFYADQWKQMFDDKNVNPVLLDLIDKMHDAHVTAIAAAELKKNMLAQKAQMPQVAAQLVASEAQSDEANAAEQDNQELQSVRDREGQVQQAQLQSQAADQDAKRQLALTAATQEIAPEPSP